MGTTNFAGLVFRTGSYQYSAGIDCELWRDQAPPVSLPLLTEPIAPAHFVDYDVFSLTTKYGTNFYVKADILRFANIVINS